MQALFLPAVLVALCCFAAPTAAAEIIAHRGASSDAPENTLASMKLGFEQQADGGELDIHQTKDGRIVVIHDADTKRTGGVAGKIADQTLDEVRKLNFGAFGKWKDKGFNEKIPSLDEVFPLVPAHKKLFIEIKCRAEALPALEELLKRGPLTPQQTVLITFDCDVAQAAKKMFPDRAVYLLSGYDKDKKTGEYPKLDDLIKKAKAASLDGLDLDWHFPLDRAAVQQVKQAGLKLYVWTLDDAKKAKELIEAGIDGITTNKPAALRKEIEQK